MISCPVAALKFMAFPFQPPSRLYITVPVPVSTCQAGPVAPLPASLFSVWLTVPPPPTIPQ